MSAKNILCWSCLFVHFFNFSISLHNLLSIVWFRVKHGLKAFINSYWLTPVVVERLCQTYVVMTLGTKFNLILDCSVNLGVDIQSAGEGVPYIPSFETWPNFWFKITRVCQSTIKFRQQICNLDINVHMYPSVAYRLMAILSISYVHYIRCAIHSMRIWCGHLIKPLLSRLLYRTRF